MDPEFRVAFRPGCPKRAIYVSRAEPGAMRAMPEPVENRQVVLAARLVADDIEQVRLERLPALTGQLTEPVTQFFGNVTNLKGNHACNTTCMVVPGARPRGAASARGAPPVRVRVVERLGAPPQQRQLTGRRHIVRMVGQPQVTDLRWQSCRSN